MSSQTANERLRSGFLRWRRQVLVSFATTWRALQERRLLVLSWLGLGGLALGQAGASAWAISAFMASVVLVGALVLPLRSDARRRQNIRIRRPVMRSGQWQGVLATLPDAAVLLNSQGAILLFNSKAAELFDNLRLGVHVVGIIRNPEFAELLREVETEAIQATAVFATRVPLERRLTISAGRLPSIEGRSDEPGFLITFRDLSEQDRLDRMRTDFIANASHELRSPLASVLGFIETLQGPAKDDPEARERFLGIMYSQARRMKRLIDDLMSLTRVEMRQHLRPRDPVDINDLVAHVAEGFEPLAVEADMRLVIVPADAPSTALGDWDELAQVLQNLIQNALRYGRRGGTITIRTDRQQQLAIPFDSRAEHGDDRLGYGTVTISVSDDGPGIAEQHLPRLTERFYRAEASGNRDRDGTGLGLAIVKHIVNRHRGELHIESALGVGSTFSVVLPAAADFLSTGRDEA